MVGSRFQSLGAAQLNDLSARVFLVLFVGKANEVAESLLRLKLYLDGGKTDIKRDFPQISTKWWHKSKNRFRSYFVHR